MSKKQQKDKIIKGQIIDGDSEIVEIRQKSGQIIEIGELLVVDIFDEKNGELKEYLILQVYMLAYGSQLNRSSMEMISGINLEFQKGVEMEFFEPNIRQYIIAGANILLKVKILKDQKGRIQKFAQPSKSLPPFFSEVRAITEEDLDFIVEKDNEIYLGKVRSGSKLIDVDVRIPARDVLTHHVLIPATTGRGKSNLMKVLLWNLMDFENCGILVLDPHDEYYGRATKCLKDHPKSTERLVYYSLNPPRKVPMIEREISINLKLLHPNDFRGIIELSGPQNEALEIFHATYDEMWLENLFLLAHKDELPDGVSQSTAAVLRRKLGAVLDLRRNVITTGMGNNQTTTATVSYNSEIFADPNSNRGESTIEDIYTALTERKIVIIDTSLFDEKVELLIGSILSRKCLNEYKNLKKQNRKGGSGGSLLEDFPPISILLEEAPRVLSNDVLRKGDNIYSTIAKEGRKFLIGLIAITQLASIIPKTILANMNTKIVLGNELVSERNAIIDSASQDLSNDSKNIGSLDKGEAIVTSNFTRFAIPIKVPLFEEVLEERLTREKSKPKPKKTVD